MRAPLGVTKGSSSRWKTVAQAVGAEAGVLAEASVVEDGHPLPDVRVAPIGHPLGVFGVAEADAGVRPVAERFLSIPRNGKALSAVALDRLAEPVPDAMRVGHQVGAVVGHTDLLGSPAWSFAQPVPRRDSAPSVPPSNDSSSACASCTLPLRPVLTSAASLTRSHPQLVAACERPDHPPTIWPLRSCADLSRRSLRRAPIRQRRRQRTEHAIHERVRDPGGSSVLPRLRLRARCARRQKARAARSFPDLERRLSWRLAQLPDPAAVRRQRG